ncbi:MAG: disulfide bond formation protein B [Candidatus Pacebacteria bacterium]|nr:disulfide bond formation protein B [Candidatus Paceibacterota bacterium]
MTFSDFLTFVFSVLTIVGIALVIVLLIFLFAKKTRGTKMFAHLDRYAHHHVFGVVFLAVFGSLLYSNVIGFDPCTLCWIQRIFMYPMLVLLIIAFVRDETKLMRPYLLWLSGLGGAVAIYQYLLQFGIVPSVVCSATAVSCAKLYVLGFGFVTIPLMSLTVFALIFLALLLQKK